MVTSSLENHLAKSTELHMCYPRAQKVYSQVYTQEERGHVSTKVNVRMLFITVN